MKPPRPRTALRKLLCVLLALTALPAAALATSSYTIIPTGLSVAMVVPPDMELYPLRVMHRDAISILDLVYDSLVIINDDMQPEPSLATSWETLSDGRTWKFTIRENVFFHDGRELTAYDVKATMDAIKATADAFEQPNQKGMYSELPSILTRWEAEDERTLRVQTNRPYYGILYAMTFPVLQAQSAFEANPPGTGPYCVDYYVPGQALWLRGNENWWFGPPPYVSEIACQWYPSESAALTAFESEKVDILMTRSTDAVRYRGTVSSRANSYTYSTRQLECLMINNAVPKLRRDVRMRQAIAYAVNIPYLKANVYQGMVLESGTLQRPGTWLYNENVGDAYPAYNPDKARALLDEMGWSQFNSEGYRTRQTENGLDELILRMFYYDEAGNSLRKEAAGRIADMLREVGIRVRPPTHYDFEGGSAKLKVGDYDLFLCSIFFDTTPDPTFLLSSSSNINYSRYNSSDMGNTLKEFRKAIEPEDFQNQWFEIQRQMAEDMPFLPLYWREGMMLTRYPFSSIRDIREYELLRSIERYK